MLKDLMEKEDKKHEGILAEMENIMSPKVTHSIFILPVIYLNY